MGMKNPIVSAGGVIPALLGSKKKKGGLPIPNLPSLMTSHAKGESPNRRVSGLPSFMSRLPGT
jgi:hypothetical protein